MSKRSRFEPWPDEEYARIAACLREAAECQPLMVEWGRFKFGQVQSVRGQSLVTDIQRRELLQLAEAAERLGHGEGLGHDLGRKDRGDLTSLGEDGDV